MNRQLVKLNWRTISIVSVLILAIYKYCVILWQFNFFHFLVPPSPDLVAHLEMTDSFINGTAKLGSYPPLLHIITAFLARIMHFGSLDVFMLIAPFWIPLSIIVFYLLVSKIFDYKIAFWSTLVFALVSSNPLLNFGDAQYADILGYNLIGPIYIIALVSLVREFKYSKLLLVFVLFCLFLSAHSLSAILLYIVSFISVAIYCFVTFNTDRRQFKNSFIVFIALCVGIIPFLALSKVFFGPIISNAISALTGGSILIKDPTSAVLEYSSILTLLSPFLEFIGFAGMGFLLIKFSKGQARFASLFVVVWILTVWFFSRNSLFVLPQRIFREISLPLSIASGILAVEMSLLFKNNWYKIGFFAIFTYLVIINETQVFVSPFLPPDGLKNQVWFRDVDQVEYDYMVAILKKNDVILSNFSNPILHYKLKVAGYKVIGFSNTEMSDKSVTEREEFISKEVKSSGARYLFIGAMPQGVNPEVYFTQFVNYEKSTSLLNEYKYPERNLMRQFTDGSKLIMIEDEDE